jgi:hypothetical protein
VDEGDDADDTDLPAEPADGETDESPVEEGSDT